MQVWRPIPIFRWIAQRPDQMTLWDYLSRHPREKGSSAQMPVKEVKCLPPDFVSHDDRGAIVPKGIIVVKTVDGAGKRTVNALTSRHPEIQAQVDASGVARLVKNLAVRVDQPLLQVTAPDHSRLSGGSAGLHKPCKNVTVRWAWSCIADIVDGQVDHRWKLPPDRKVEQFGGLSGKGSEVGNDHRMNFGQSGNADKSNGGNCERNH